MKLIGQPKAIRKKGKVTPTSKEVTVAGSDVALGLHYHDWARNTGEWVRSAAQDERLGEKPQLPETYHIRARWTNNGFIEITDVWVCKSPDKGKRNTWIRFFGGNKTSNGFLVQLLPKGDDCSELYAFIEELEARGVLPRLAQEGPPSLEVCGPDLREEAPPIDRRQRL